MSRSRRLNAEEVRRIAFSGIGAGFTKIGASYSHPISKIVITNSTDVSLAFSHDGVITHIDIPTEGTFVLDINYNSSTSVSFPLGDALYVKQDGVPSVGKVSFSAYYIED